MGALTAWIAARFAGLWTKLAVLGAAVVAVLAITARIFYAGKRSARDEVAAKNAGATKTAKGIADEVHSMDRADVDSRLARWMRDGKR